MKTNTHTAESRLLGPVTDPSHLILRQCELVIYWGNVFLTFEPLVVAPPFKWLVSAASAYTLDGVNLKGYFAYALNDQRDPEFGLYGQVQQEVIVKASLSNYRNIIQHNGFPILGGAPQQCPSRPQPCSGCNVLVSKPVVGFLTLVGSGVLITLGLIIYYTARGHKECY